MSSTTNATALRLKVAAQLAMGDQLFVEYLTHTYPDPAAFASVTSDEHFLSTMYHCWMYGRKLLADEFLALQLAIESAKPQRCPECENFGGGGTIQDGQHAIPCRLCGTDA